MFNKYYSIFLLLGMGFGTMAQTTVSLGVATGAGSTNVLLSTSTTSNRYSRTMSVYTASEIITAGGAAGTITSLAWDKQGTGEYITNDAYIKVYLKHVSNSDWPSAPVPIWDTIVKNATEVFTSNSYSIPTGIGWKAVPFTTPFVWNGTDNVVVMVEWDRSNTPTSAINWGRSTTTNANATRVGSSSLAALIMLVNSSRPLLQLTINAGPAVTGISVKTQGNLPAVISTNGGSLQMEADVLPGSVNQAVNWSVTNGTGQASISATGLVTAQSNGTVWAKAVSVQDPSIMDSLMVTISNQNIPIVSLVVTAQGGSPTISVQGGTLQMEATILPVNANQTVMWSIVPVSGTASVNSSGLVTAQTNGVVWARAVSVQDPTKKDSLQITITNQSIGISENSLGAISIYPNPVVGRLLNISCPEGYTAFNDVQISIYTISGQLVLSEKMSATNHLIDLNHCLDGTYILKLEDKEYQENRVIVLK